MNYITKANQAVIRREMYVTIITILNIHILQYSNYILQRMLYEPEALLMTFHQERNACSDNHHTNYTYTPILLLNTTYCNVYYMNPKHY